jgi:hypothetical protein
MKHKKKGSDPDVQVVPYTDRHGRECRGYNFEPGADYSRGYIAIAHAEWDAAAVSINPDANLTAGELPFRFAGFKHNTVKQPESPPVYWILPLSVKRDWFVHDAARVADPMQMLQFLSVQLKNQK